MKIHTRISKSQPNTPSCGYRNARRYEELPAGRVLPPQEYRQQPDECRCKLCDDLYLITRNRQRKQKGLAPVSTPFEGL